MIFNPTPTKSLSISDSVFNYCLSSCRKIIDIKIRFTLLLFFSGGLLYSQEIEDKSITEQIWVDYNWSSPVSDRLSIYGDVAVRTVFPNEWYRFAIGPSARYIRPKFIFKQLYYKEELHAGLRLFFTFNRDNSNRLEIRPFQGYKLSWPNRPYIIINHYFRLEERFDIETARWVNTFGLRFRYMGELILKFKGSWLAFGKGLYLPVNIELFWNLIGTKQFNDAARIMPGLGYVFPKNWRAEVQIGYHYSRNTVQDVFSTNDFVFRLRIFHNLMGENIEEKSKNEP